MPHVLYMSVDVWTVAPTAGGAPHTELLPPEVSTYDSTLRVACRAVSGGLSFQLGVPLQDALP